MVTVSPFSVNARGLGVVISVVALLSLLGLPGFERYRQRKQRETAGSPRK